MDPSILRGAKFGKGSFSHYLGDGVDIRIVDKTENKSSHNTFHKTVGNKDIGNSFVNVVKGSGMSLETGSTPTIVLDDECLNTKDLSCSLMGRVKEFTSLSNLKKVLCNEGFDVLKISYLVYWMRAKEVPGWTPEFTEEEEKDDVSVEDNHGGIHSGQEINNCNDESDVEEVPETCFNVPEGQKGNPSKDPFIIYPLLKKDKNIREHKINEEESSLKHLPRFTPVDSMGSCRLKKPGMPRTGGSILSFMEEVVKVGQTMGYNMDGDFVDNSGGILCMWDPNSFCKSSFMISDYFVIIRGLCLKSWIKLMIVVVYAPQEASEKRMLWDYLTHVSINGTVKLL
nr:nucleotide-binding alpha-beta plait domain-containing protein [Tanacetum cinerariifolium]